MPESGENCIKGCIRYLEFAKEKKITLHGYKFPCYTKGSAAPFHLQTHRRLKYMMKIIVTKADADEDADMLTNLLGVEGRQARVSKGSWCCL